MALRPTMAGLIARTRQLIFDTAQEQVFADSQIQDALDLRRRDVRTAALAPVPSFQTGGQTVYLDYYSDAAAWEDDVTLQSLSFADITASVVLREPLVGHWAFAQQPDGVGVRITGKVYDLYGSAADLLEQWAAQVKLCVSFSSDGQTFRLDGQGTALLALAARYRAQALPQITRLRMTDDAPEWDGSGVTYPAYGAAGGGWA